MPTHHPAPHPRRTARIALTALAALVIAAAAAFALLYEPPPPPLPPLEVTWTPAEPAQGHLFLIRVAAPPDSGAVSATGEAGGETLHFHATDSTLESFAPVPINATDSIDAWVQATYPDGRTQADSLRIPIVEGTYEHERLTVAPRFGSPPNEEDQARLARDREKAAQVSRDAGATPRLWSPAMVMPRSSRVTSEFGTGREFNGQISSRHMGLDLQGFTGDTVVAAADGVVALVDGFLYAGNLVYLNHGGGVVSGYFHLSEQLVETGDTVTAGTPIGRVGATGRVTGPHLHWVVRYGSTTVDPRSLLALVR
ncbi:MAG: M23 family metallopeptidase [Gemmatimonadota bacterium]|nr:M23 family metallopeptidase [Gemmatimonadota bacterium]